MDRRGSSPRVRGSPVPHICEDLLDGIIPAGAGLTSVHPGTVTCSGDHPRGCGAHSAVMIEILTCQGSSPRVRGSRRRWSLMARDHGIIPAGAGLTLPPN